MAGDENPTGDALPSRTPLGAVADEAFDRIAALVRTVLGVPVGLVSFVDRDGQVFPGQSGLPQPWSESRCTPLTHSFCQYVVRTAQPLIVADARLDPMLASNLAIVDISVVAYAGIPLVDLDGTVVGSLCAIDTEPHDWTDSEIALLTDLAATCSAEIKLRSAAIAARRSQSRTSALLALSETLSNTVTTGDVSRAVSTLAMGRLGGAFGGIMVLDADERTLTSVDLGALPASMSSEYRTYPLSMPTPASSAVLTGQAYYFETLEQLRAAYPEAAQAMSVSQARSCAYLPLRVGDRIIGTVTIVWSNPRTFTDNDKALLVGLSRYTAQAVERALLLADRRHVAETLQAAMLPTLPKSELAELTARYFPARTTDAVGGDWYDAFELPDGSLAISVGDVEGHDISAAAVMGQLRATLRGLAIALPASPADVLTALDTVLTSQPPGRLATGILASLAKQAHATVLSWSNAGHLPPLLLAPGQPPSYLEQIAERLLGTPIAPEHRTTHTAALPAGSTLILFTDGLVERRHRDLADCFTELAESADRHRGLDLSEMIDAILADLDNAKQEDDVVVLGMRVPSGASDGR